MRPLTASPAPTALPAAHFDRNERYAYFGDRTLEGLTLSPEQQKSITVLGTSPESGILLMLET
jgi:hypothetical protein